MVMVEAELKERITVNVRRSLKRAVEREAETAGQTLSVWVERALAERLVIKDREAVRVQTD